MSATVFTISYAYRAAICEKYLVTFSHKVLFVALLIYDAASSNA